MDILSTTVIGNSAGRHIVRELTHTSWEEIAGERHKIWENVEKVIDLPNAQPMRLKKKYTSTKAS